MTEKQEVYLNSKIDRYIEESFREDGTFDKEWFTSNIKSVIKEIINKES
jgi:hypothetical protein